jgi:mannose-6-phosphate isomerase-like protein (cupin superfamily)
MPEFVEIAKKGLSRCWIEEGVDPQRLHLHISEIAPGTRAHPPHTHAGTEVFYILSGSGVFEMNGTRVPLSANQAVIIDPQTLHGLENTGSTPMRYIVFISQA